VPRHGVFGQSVHGEEGRCRIARAAAEAGPEVSLPEEAVEPSARRRADRYRADLAAALLGYDLLPDGNRTSLPSYLEARDELRAADADVVADEAELLGVFTDFAELARNRPADEERRTELRVHSSREHFHSYLRSLDVDRGGLPEEFRRRLTRVLARYGVPDLERTPELEDAVFRIFLAQQRPAAEVDGALHLFAPYDLGVFYGAFEKGGLKVVCLPQLYADLIHYERRGPDQAEHVRREAMGY
jgi:hypothetical protein